MNLKYRFILKVSFVEGGFISDDLLIGYLDSNECVSSPIKELGVLYQTLDYECRKKNLKNITFTDLLCNTIEPDIALIIQKIGLTYKKINNYEKSIELQEAALKIFQGIYLNDNLFTATSFHNIGTTYQEKGDLKKALDYFESGLKKYEQLLKRDHPLKAGTLHNIGIIHLKLNNSEKALSYMNQALSIYRLFPETDNLDIASLLQSLSYAYQNLGNTLKAVDRAQEALIFYQKVYERDHPTLALCFHNIGVGYQKLGEIKKSLIYLERAEEIYRKLNKNDEKNAYNLGIAYLQSGENKTGLKYLEKARATMSQTDNPQLASILQNIGIVYQKLDNKQACEYLEQALILYERLYKDEDNSNTALCLYNLSFVYRKFGNKNKQLEYLKKSLEIYQRLHHSNDTDMNYLNKNKQELENDLSVLVKRLDFHMKMHKGNHKTAALTLENIGMINDIIGNKSIAQENYLKAYEMYQKLKGDFDSNVASLLYKLALVDDNINYDKTLEYSLKAIEIYTRLHRVSHKNSLFIELKSFNKEIECLKEEFLISSDFFLFKSSTDKNFNTKAHLFSDFSDLNSEKNLLRELSNQATEITSNLLNLSLFIPPEIAKAKLNFEIIVINRVLEHARNIKRVSAFFELKPHGVQFNSPVALKFKDYGSENICLFKKENLNDKEWIVIFPIKLNENVLEFELQHFSFFFLGIQENGILIRCDQKLNQQEFNKKFKEHERIYSGLSYRVNCDNIACDGHKRLIIVHRGFSNTGNNGDSFDVNNDIDFNIKNIFVCPFCNKLINEYDNFKNLIFYQANGVINYKLKKGGLQERKFRIDGNNLLLFGNKRQEFTTLEIIVNPNQTETHTAVSFSPETLQEIIYCSNSRYSDLITPGFMSNLNQ